MSIDTVRIALKSLTVYRKVLQDDVISRLHILTDSLHDSSEDAISILDKYNEFYHVLLEKGKGCSLKDYMIKRILFLDNIYASSVQSSSCKGTNEEISQLAKEDLKLLSQISTFSAGDMKEALMKSFGAPNIIVERIMQLPQCELELGYMPLGEYNWIVEAFRRSTSWEDCINSLEKFYKQNGSGIWGEYKGFIWDGDGLEGVLSLDSIRFKDLIGYEAERQKVIDNTLAFLEGYPANNILLYGSRGTGKSSTVKALLNEYHTKGLRIIEISKQHLSTFPKVIREIKAYPQKFILFIDDLSFDENDEGYAALKAVLEGGLETRPSNVVIYATSNRRHFVKEKFSDRAGILSDNKSDEIRAVDTMEEKLSLADRFGITVTFTSPSQKQYLAIVDGLVRSRGLKTDKEELHAKAIQWEMWYNGRSPRTARQFVDWLESNL